MIKIKKFLFTLLVIISSFNIVRAKEYPEITNDVEIRYKWYKEVIEGDYYPMKEELEGYLIDEYNIKYGEYSIWSQDNCNLSNKYYQKEYKTIRVYRTPRNVRYVKLENFVFDNNIKIYQNNQLLDYEIMSTDKNIVKIDLKQEYRSDVLTFFIQNAQNYKISLYTNNIFTDLIISKEIENEILLIPDETWLAKDAEYNKHYTEEIYINTGLTKKIGEYNICQYREKYIYKYQIKKDYYDDNYHLNVDGYIKDTSDYKVFYKGEPIINTIEITKEKIIKEPQIEYIYIPSENEIIKNDSSKEIKQETKIDCLPEIKTEVIKKEIFKIPKKIYIIILLLTLIIILLTIKLIKKHVD